jgi:hypothetical protein
LLAIISFATKGLLAQDSTSQLQIYGQLLTDQRLLYDNGDWVWSENRLTLNLEKKLTGNSKFFSEIWLRNIGLPQYYSLADLYNKNITDPWNLEIRQAYVSAYGLINGKLDLTVGKQIFAWGTADKFNPTNNLNPYDFEDVLDFGRKRGVIALKADFYLNSDNYFELALVPQFRPIGMPAGIFSQMLNTEQLQLPENVNFHQSTDSLWLPAYMFKDNFSAGIRFKGFIAGIDYSLSYVYGYDPMPVPVNTTINLSLISSSSQYLLADVHTDLSFYRQHILGADFSTNLAGVGLWGEMALFVSVNDLMWQITTIYPEI